MLKGIGLAGARKVGPAEAEGRNPWAGLRELWTLARHHRILLATSLLLIVINRVAALVFPGSTRVLIDEVIAQHKTYLLLPLIGAVLAATATQGITSFVLIQSLSKAAQRLIAELRIKVHAHLSRLPIAYYDENNTGALTARVMNDVEGVRTLFGTGLIEFIGGSLTSIMALLVLLWISPVLTAVALPLLAGLGLALWKSFETLRPIFRERNLISAEVTGRLSESLAGIRVVKAYQAESRENSVFANGVRRLLENAFRTLYFRARPKAASSRSWQSLLLHPASGHDRADGHPSRE